MRLLLIEDDATVADGIELMLKSEDIDVQTTELGQDGLDLGSVFLYDLILLDLIALKLACGPGPKVQIVTPRGLELLA